MRYLLILIISIFTSSLTYGQNLIAKVEASEVDITLLGNKSYEDLEFPSAEIYDTWSNGRPIFGNLEGKVESGYIINLKDFTMPTMSQKVTSPYGQRWGRLHAGIDIKVYICDTIQAAFSGKVRVVGYDKNGYGNFVVIRHNNGLETLYGHLSKSLVKANDIVKSGAPIGLGGNTGRSTGSHLHFETRILGVSFNPALLFDFPNQDVTGDFFTITKDIKKGRS